MTYTHCTCTLYVRTPCISTQTYGHGEVRVSLVVVEDIPDQLVEHGEERVEGTKASEVHDVIQVLGIL